jgi:hypothetical protein
MHWLIKDGNSNHAGLAKTFRTSASLLLINKFAKSISIFSMDANADKTVGFFDFLRLVITWGGVLGFVPDSKSEYFR